MGVSLSEKTELASYKLKDVAQTWYIKWRDNVPLRGDPLTWAILKTSFLDFFFTREMREYKATEFINLRQGGKSVHDYPLEFIK